MSSDLVIAGARKTFITPEKVELNAVDNVSFTIESGEFFVMLGPSGCGKTTLLRTIAGLESLDDGTITLGEKRIDNIAPHLRPVNTVFQSYALFPHLTIWQNVAFGLQMEKKSKSEIASTVDEMLDPENMAVAVNHQGYASGVAGTNELMDAELKNSSAITIPEGYTGAKPVQPCNNKELENYSKIWEAFKG